MQNTHSSRRKVSTGCRCISACACQYVSMCMYTSHLPIHARAHVGACTATCAHSISMHSLMVMLARACVHTYTFSYSSLSIACRYMRARMHARCTHANVHGQMRVMCVKRVHAYHISQAWQQDRGGGQVEEGTEEGEQGQWSILATGMQVRKYPCQECGSRCRAVLLKRA